MYSPDRTKADFPEIMTRGRVTHGRMDLALEAQGNIFGGRDEKHIMFNKKEAERRMMQEELQKQIAEKAFKKQQEVDRMKRDD